MYVHGADVTAVFVSPDSVQKGFSGVNTVGIAHQKFDDIEFLGGEVGQFAGAVGIPGIQIQSDGANGQLVGGSLLLSGAGTAAA